MWVPLMAIVGVAGDVAVEGRKRRGYYGHGTKERFDAVLVNPKAWRPSMSPSSSSSWFASGCVASIILMYSQWGERRVKCV